MLWKPPRRRWIGAILGGLLGHWVLLTAVMADQTANQAANQAAEPALMLATDWEQGMDPGGWWVSEKYDGIRGYWDGHAMWTRGGQPLSLPPAWRRALPDFPLDGELWAGRGGFQRVQQVVMDATPGDGWAEIAYLVFDVPRDPAVFPTRLERLRRWLAEQSESPAFLRVVEQRRCADAAQLQTWLADVMAAGGEGLILRTDASPYVAGPSPDLRKLKPYQEGEALVVGYRPGAGRYQGLLGALVVRLTDGTEFALGSGLSDAERRQPPPLDSRVAFRHWGWTEAGKPRFGVFLRRLDADPDTMQAPAEAGAIQ